MECPIGGPRCLEGCAKGNLALNYSPMSYTTETPSVPYRSVGSGGTDAHMCGGWTESAGRGRKITCVAWNALILVAPSQAGRTPCYHRFESKNRSARNPDSGPVRQPPKQRRAATVMEGADAIIDPARSSGPRAGHGARDGVGSGAIARGRRHSGRADPHRQGAARRQGERRAARRQLQGAARPARLEAAA